ncbi:maltose ABC transporter substrate-binding protein [Petroclostridium xylanilyticum]|uniref:sugar ABC transporter substrate-binding protein n=1 Tax=Petroclostridium xylanilyticum TaxID=1792311 RepID=UPI000B98E748|nr:maltose ABC transporter substrate-binding protein [Petroclostridium xylanilyticum]
MSKRSKKVLTIMLVVVLTTVMTFGMTGCGKKAEVEAPKERAEQTQAAATAEKTAGEETGLKPEPGAKLKVWDSEGPEGEWLQEAIKKFTEQYGVEVTYEPVGHTDSTGKLQTDGPAKLGADVFSAPHDHVGKLVASGLIYPNDVLKAEDYMDAAVQGTSYQGKWYGYPMAIETYALFYNKDLVKEPPKTFDELIAFSKQFNDVKNSKYGFMMEVGNFYFVYSFLAGYDGYVFGKNGTDVNDIGLNSAGAVEGAKFHQKLKEILPLNTADINYDIKKGLFNEGKLAFNIDGPWAVKGHKDAGVNFGVAPLPLLPNGKHPASFSGIRAFYVNSYTNYPNAAKLLAQFLSSKEMLTDRFKSTGQIPPRKDLLSDTAITSDPIAAAFLEQAQYAQAMPNVPEMASVWGPMGTALEENWNKGGDPKPILDNAVKSIKDALATQSK